MLIIKRLVGSVAFKDGVPVFQNESGHHIDAPLKSNLIFTISTSVLHCGYLIPAMHKRFFADRCRQRTDIDAADKLIRMLSVLDSESCR